MKNQNFELASSDEINIRLNDAHEFYFNILDPEEQPFFVSDEASIFDISSDSEEYLIKKCFDYYGVKLTCEQLTLPFWQVLDLLKGSSPDN